MDDQILTRGIALAMAALRRDLDQPARRDLGCADTLDRSPLQGWKAHRRGSAATLRQTRAVCVRLL
jgi:hypothetical protein